MCRLCFGRRHHLSPIHGRSSWRVYPVPLPQLPGGNLWAGSRRWRTVKSTAQGASQRWRAWASASGAPVSSRGHRSRPSPSKVLPGESVDNARSTVFSRGPALVDSLERRWPVLQARKLFFPHYVVCNMKLEPSREGLDVPERGPKSDFRETTLSGGSLGSWVDEERSQLRELM